MVAESNPNRGGWQSFVSQAGMNGADLKANSNDDNNDDNNLFLNEGDVHRDTSGLRPWLCHYQHL